ncbi:TlpA family protein disulfide reductase [Flavivirga spongiicola]|uniref:TlpA family protein disulfide reductase n=1 Tax=Flavivirga spongiicola TaxID=421621 RepID=A0ABU7XPZ3_9FLAO|nr:TlpA disulfide reductase family protein [Flavivirga sp. MEBiC05379]MDO5977839.1 TlpA disulfide reductase family protein [Flavivirga sp. MEBiC05379]
MKKIVYILSIALVFVSCKEEAPKDYVTLSGTITNQNSDSLIVAQRGIIKTIKVSPEGVFSDTLKVEAGHYILFDGKEQAKVYLKNGYDLKIKLDTKAFDETIKYEGNGAEANNYLAQKGLLNETLINFEELMASDKAGFDKSLNNATIELKALLDKTQGLDSTFIAGQEKEVEMTKKQLTMMYDQKQTLLALKGQESPKFVDYENYAGGTTSLDDLKGKFVYIDVWATWCGPCKAEIPYLKEVEKAYHDKNIEFVSISVDKAADQAKWKEMIAEKELGGIQLIADNNFKSGFVQDYKINGIPRFILIDPNGNIVSADAPRPSNEKLKDLFNELKI